MRLAKILAVVLATAALSVSAIAQTAATDMAPLGPDHKVPNHGRPPEHVNFPKIHDWNSLTITLSRSPCFGACPVYDVTIHGDGSVDYNGAHFVGTMGEQHAKISRGKVRDLYARFKRADFFWLYDNYHAFVTDLPTAHVSISYDGQTKQVTDYAGGMIGMPEVVSDLETAVDRAAGTKKWIKGWKPGQPQQ
jgi:hypothetical protein